MTTTNLNGLLKILKNNIEMIEEYATEEEQRIINKQLDDFVGHMSEWAYYFKKVEDE